MKTLSHHAGKERRPGALNSFWLQILIATLGWAFSAGPLAAAPKGDLIDDTPPAQTKSTAAVVAAVAASAAAPEPKANADGCLEISFQELSGYDIEVPVDLDYNTNNPGWADKQVNSQIPAHVRSYDKKKVSIEGFIIPTTYDANNNLTDFILARNQASCCYGGTPQIHEFILVHLKIHAEPHMDEVTHVEGVISVGAQRDDGNLTSVYRMDADLVEAEE